MIGNQASEKNACKHLLWVLRRQMCVCVCVCMCVCVCVCVCVRVCISINGIAASKVAFQEYIKNYNSITESTYTSKGLKWILDDYLKNG
jgi:hypothetical protein